jgi:hypothetical protein
MYGFDGLKPGSSYGSTGFNLYGVPTMKVLPTPPRLLQKQCECVGAIVYVSLRARERREDRGVGVRSFFWQKKKSAWISFLGKTALAGLGFCASDARCTPAACACVRVCEAGVAEGG